jgi:hypothetical protein
MIQSLGDAWKWYTAVRTLAYDMIHVAGRWDRPEWAAAASHDNRLGDRTAGDLSDMARTILDDLDHLAVLVLFSVFESSVRAQAEADVDRELALISHAAVLQVVKELKEAIANGSFAKVTAAYQQLNTDLTAQVNQIRKFRNWVAHGRRGEPENNVLPDEAFERLTRYLDLLSALQHDGGTSTQAP